VLVDLRSRTKHFTYSLAVIDFNWMRGQESDDWDSCAEHKEKVVPVISMFYGIIVSLYFRDNTRHHRPHIHVKFQSDEAVIAIPEAEVLEGSLPTGKMRMVVAWVEIHKDEIMADWEIAVNGQQPFKIDPLR